MRPAAAAVAAVVAVLSLTASRSPGREAGAGSRDDPPRRVAPATRPASPPASAAVRPPIVIAVQTDERVVGFSFDDGPDPRWTPGVLAALAAAGARATFFVTGERVRAHPQLLRDVAAAGHEVANHTDTHPQVDDLPGDAVAAEVARAASAIEGAGVRAAPMFRPPRGRYDAEALEAVGRAGLRTVGWTVCVERWLRHGGAVAGTAAVVARVEPGGIVLAHDGGIPDRAATVAALPVLLARLTEERYRIVPVGELLALGPPREGLPGAGAYETVVSSMPRDSTARSVSISSSSSSISLPSKSERSRVRPSHFSTSLITG